MLMHLFYRCLVQTYLLFSNLIKLTFHHWHLFIHESFAPRKVCCKHRAEELGYVFTLLANFEESGTGVSHEVGLAALGIDSNIDFRYYYLVTLGKGNGTSVDAIEPAMKELETAFHAASQEMYQAQQQAGAQAGPQPGAQPNAGNQGGDNVTDVDFEEVK